MQSHLKASVTKVDERAMVDESMIKEWLLYHTLRPATLIITVRLARCKQKEHFHLRDGMIKSSKALSTRSA